MNEKVTLNKTLSTVFIEIREIALYNSKIREKLHVAYREWIGNLSGMLASFTDDAAVSRRGRMAEWGQIFILDTLDYEKSSCQR
jgi:hypothetical protein